jgi:predicted permease
MLETLSRVAVFFGFIALGALLVRLKRLDQSGLNGLSAYFYWLAFPCWLLVSFSRLPPLDSGHAFVLAVYVVAMLLAALIAVIIMRLFGGDRSHVLAAGMAALINNSAFLGVPVVASLFGPKVMVVGPLIVAADFLVLFSIGCAALAKASGHTLREAMAHTAKNPTVIGAALGVILMSLGAHFPPALDAALDMLGKSGPPVALVALGGMLGLMPAPSLIRPDRLSMCAIAGKILLAPSLVALMLYLLRVDALTFRVCVFLSATPTAVSVFVQTRMYDFWSEGAARTVAQSTLISLFTLSGLALILSI